MNETENKPENETVIRKNWMPITVMLAWVINTIWGGYGMMDGSYKEAASHFLFANIFAMMYTTFFTKFYKF